MAELKIEQLGDVEPGDIKKNALIDHGIDPIPILLGSENRNPTVLYQEHNIKVPIAHGTLSINRIDTESGLKAKLKNAFDGYPIKFTGTAITQRQQDSMDIILEETLIKADIDGDGEQELIYGTGQGGVFVYDKHKKRFHHKLSIGFPSVGYFELRPWAYHIARLDGRDIVYLVMNRVFFDDVKDDNGERKLAKKYGTYEIVRVDQDGIHPITLQGVRHDPYVIHGIALLNLPGSTKIDEIVTFVENDYDENKVWMHRNRVDGSQIAPPRQTYDEHKLIDRVAFKFVPQSAQIVGIGEGQVYFVTPAKEVNWIRHIDARKLLDGEGFKIYAAFRNNNRTYVLMDDKKSFFLLDDEARFNVWHGDQLQATRQKTALATLTAPSKLHERIGFFYGTERSDRHEVVAVYHRKQQLKEMSDEEIEAAAKRFIVPGLIEAYHEETTWSETEDFASYKRNAEYYCEDHKIKCPPLTSIEDIKKKLPDFLKALKQEFREKLIDRYKSELLSVVGWEQDGDTTLSDMESIFINKAQYYQWLKDKLLPPELAVVSMDIKGNIVIKGTLKGYEVIERHYTSLPVFFASKSHWDLVLPLKEIQNYRPKKNRFWLIHWEG